MLEAPDVVGPIEKAWQVSYCAFCCRTEYWTQQKLNPLIYGPGYVRQYSPKGWHTAGSCPEFCTQLCHDDYHEADRVAAKARQEFVDSRLNSRLKEGSNVAS